MSIIGRLERLEKVIVVRVPVPTLISVRNPEMTDEDLKKAAVAEYKAKHSGWKGDDFQFIIAWSEEGKRLCEALMNGEGPHNARK